MVYIDPDDPDEYCLSGGDVGSVYQLSDTRRKGAYNKQGGPIGFNLAPYGVDHGPDDKPTRRRPKRSRNKATRA